MSREKLGILQVIAASFCFGFLGIFSRWAAQNQLSTGFLLSYRFALATVLVIVFFLIFKPNTLAVERKTLALSSALGFFGYAVFSTLYFMAIERVSVALAVMLLYTYPFWVHLITHFWGQKMKAFEWIALVLASIGLLLLLWGEITINSIWGVFFGLGAALSYALYILASHRYQQNLNAWTVSVYVMAAATVGLFLFHRPFALSPTELNSSQALVIVSISVFGTILPLSLIQSSLQKLTGAQVSLLSLFEPLTAVLASTALLGESLHGRQWLGFFIVLGSLVYKTIQESRLGSPT